MASPFGSEKIINKKYFNDNLKTYFIGFDLNNNGGKYYRLEKFVDVLTRTLPEFALGHHEGTDVNITNFVPKLSEAARSVYKIKDFEDVGNIYLKCDSVDDDSSSKEFLERGEFGELILHLILRDFHNTIPLISKIYFKDAYNSPAHGFDAVHIQPDTGTLWLGEAKMYTDGKKGVRALAKDVKEHFNRDYLNDEFAIVSKKIKPFDNIPQKSRWLNLMDRETTLIKLFKNVNIPLLCTYTSNNFSNL